MKEERYKVIKTSRPDIIPVGSTLIDDGEQLWVSIPGEGTFYYTSAWTEREEVFESNKDDEIIILVKKEKE